MEQTWKTTVLQTDAIPGFDISLREWWLQELVDIALSLQADHRAHECLHF